MTMQIIEFVLSLDQFSPPQVIELHQKGVLTINEIILSGRAQTEFGDTLKEYIRAHKKAERTIIINTPTEEVA